MTENESKAQHVELLSNKLRDPLVKVGLMYEAAEQLSDYARLLREPESSPSQAVSVPSVEAMATRFLSWRLPDDFCPDGGISFTPIPRHPGWTHDTWPIGTNLFTDTQAKAMIQHMLAAAPPDLWRPIKTLRCDDGPVLLFAERWIDADFNPEGIREGFRNEGDNGPILSARWCNCHDCWETDEDSAATHWMPRPTATMLVGIREQPHD